MLNYANMTDLTYHLKLINYLKQHPPVETEELRLNTSSALGSRKEQADYTEDEGQESGTGMNR